MNVESGAALNIGMQGGLCMYDTLQGLKIITFVRTTYGRQDLQAHPENINQHWHDYYQMVFVRRGKGALVIDGTFYPVGENEIIIVCPNEPHTFSISSETMETYEVKYTLQEPRLDILRNLPRSVCADTDGAIKRALKQIEAESDALGLYSMDVIALELYKILLLIRRGLSPVAEREKPRKIRDDIEATDAFFESVTAYIDENIDKQFTVKDISEHFYTEYTYFSRLFSAKYGMRLKQYINHKRIALAKELITGTNLSMTEISAKCGFENLHRMERSFKKEEGIAPSDFRRRFKLRRTVRFKEDPKTYYQHEDPFEGGNYEQC